MKKFIIRVVETTVYEKEVEAESREAAEELLDDEDFKDELFNSENVVDGDAEYYVDGDDDSDDE